MSFTINTHNESTVANAINDRPVDLYVTPEVDSEAGELVIRIPLAKVPEHIGVTREKDTGKVTGAGFAVKLNPQFTLAGSMEANSDALAKLAGDRYAKGQALAVALAPSSRGLWIGARIAADMKPTK